MRTIAHATGGSARSLLKLDDGTTMREGEAETSPYYACAKCRDIQLFPLCGWCKSRASNEELDALSDFYRALEKDSR